MNIFLRRTALTALLCCSLLAEAQKEYSRAVATDPVWHHIFVQLGLDMSLQNPYNHNFAHVFPNGKTFGVDLAAGKWFTPELGIRARLNWENGIRLLENGHASWLAPFGRNGINMDQGGYLAFMGDVRLGVSNLLWGYRPERKLTLSFYPRAGLLYNFGADKGSPLVGMGIDGTYKIAPRWNLCLEVAYQMVSSGHTGGDDGSGTGTGSGSNGYADVSVGVQIDLTPSTFSKPGESKWKHAVATNSLWDNWYVQAGVGMSLQSPYGKNLKNTFPNGKTYGINMSMGKWFSPEVGLRGGFNWQNGLLENDHLSWVAPFGRNGINHDKGGFLALFGEMQFSLHNIIAGYDASRRWNAVIYPRAGLVRNFAIGSFSPLVGGGIINTYRLGKRLSLFADVAYQGTTSEFVSDRDSWSGPTGANSNGYIDVSVGVQMDLGNNQFNAAK